MKISHNLLSSNLLPKSSYSIMKSFSNYPSNFWKWREKMISKGPFSGGMDFERMLLVKVSQIRTLAGEYKLL